MTSTDPEPDDDASMTFTSAPLDEPIEILGTPEVELTLTTDRTVGLVGARLLAVAPEGPAHLICRGSRNLAFPGSMSEPRKPVPGEAVALRFPLRATSAVIPAGWRVRLSLAGADFPIAWPPGRRFTLQVDSLQSRLHLPVVPVRPSESHLDLPPAGDLPVPPVETWRSDSDWSVRRDDHETTFERTSGHTEYQPEREDLTYVADQVWSVSVDDYDPATTKASSRCVLRLQRPGWHVETAGTLEITGDESDFHVVIELAASLNGDEVFRREWVEEIEREWA